MATPHQNTSLPAEAEPVTVSFTVRARIRGVEGDLKIQNHSAREIFKRLDQLVGSGLVEIVETASDWQRTPEGDPICAKHGVAMKLREKQGDRWWSHNVGTEKEPCYCRGYRGAESPGFDL